MKLTTVQWNIGGGKILNSGSDPTLMVSYSRDGIEDIITFLKAVDPAIVTLQEVHGNEQHQQVEYIAAQLGLAYCVSDFYADSHVEAGQKLGHAILSKYPITNHRFTLFTNPNIDVTWEDGSLAHTHDKGVTRCLVRVGNRDVEDRDVEVMTTHLIPFSRFNIDLASLEGQLMLADMQHKLTSTAAYCLLQGDFNLDYAVLEEIVPQLFIGGLREVEQSEPTTPKQHRYDHVLYRGLELVDSRVDSTVVTDHYPVITKFEI